MSSFVDECRKEWNRLGVPQADASEMAADLAADLADAEADGVSPEEVLGNGFFDAKSFAAAWARARGVVPAGHRPAREARRLRWTLVVAAVVSFIVAASGLLIVGGRQGASVATAVFHRQFPGPFLPPRAVLIGPHLPGRLLLLHGAAFQGLGLILLVAGLVGLGLTLWLWKPWSTLRRRPGSDENGELPSFL